MKKKSKVIAIVILMLLISLFPFISKNESIAVQRGSTVEGIYSNSGYGSTTWANVLNNTKKEVYISSNFFKNDFVFCIELGQNLGFGRSALKYTFKKITIDGSEKGVYNGLAYILSQDGARNNSSDWTNYHNDPNQLALWHYLKVYVNYLPSEFPNNINDVNGSTTVGYLGIRENGEFIYGGNNAIGKKACEIFSKAKDIKKGTGGKYYKADVYVLSKSSDQKLILVDSTSSENKIPTINLKFYKKDSSGNALTDVKIKVSNNSNTDLSDTTLTSAGDNGYFGQISFKPKNNNGTVKIDVEETTGKSGYQKLPSKVTLTVKYNTSNGNVTSITPETYADYFSCSSGATGTITIKNPIILQRFLISKNITDAVFSISIVNAVEARINKKFFVNEEPILYDDTTKRLEGNFYIFNPGPKGIKIGNAVTNNIDSIKGYNGENWIGILFTDIKPSPTAKYITFTIGEQKAPSEYLKMNGYAKFSLEIVKDGFKLLSGDNYTKKDGSISDSECMIYPHEHEANDTSWKNWNYNFIFRPGYTDRIQTSSDPTCYYRVRFQNLKITSISLKLNKIAESTSTTKTPVSNATFRATFEQDGKIIATKTVVSNSEGAVSFGKVQPKTTSDITVEIIETVPSGWAGSYSKEITLTYDSNNKKWNSTDALTEVSENEAIVSIGDVKNYPKLDKLTILKTDILNNKLDKAKFKITITNAVSVKGYSANSSNQIVITNDTTQGLISLEDLVLKDVSKDVVITIEETEAPSGYKKLEGKITITLQRDGNTYKIKSATKDPSISENEFKTSDASINNNILNINIKDVKLIDLSGQVWLDAQTGTKAPKPIDGEKSDTEEKIQGVKVYLYNADGTYANKETITDEDGRYAFNKIEQTASGYKIVFEYNGIKYEDTITGKNSKAEEDITIRDTFNARFTTIIGDNSVENTGLSNDGTPLKYIYDATNKVSTLNAGVDGTNPASADKNFKMQATTATYTDATNNIDFGLVERYFDLELTSKVESVKYTINGMELTDPLTDEADKSNISRAISNSDYYYRYDDLVSDKALKDSEAEAIVRKEILGEDTELEVYVTYKLTVRNQSTYEAKVNEIKYEYTSEQELVSIKNTNNEDVPHTDSANIITINSNQMLTETKNAEEIYITFKLSKNSERSLPEAIATAEGLNCINTAEITSYSTTQGGLTDCDSAPGNLGDRKQKDSIREDDETYTSANFKLSETSREISGNVAEANNLGELIENKNINGVTVQLIETFKSNGVYVEYIWQETETGSNEVKTIDTDGVVYTYNNGLGENAKGQYQFLGYSVITGTKKGYRVGFIPGNYIVRFIYGDGTTEDIRKYNGQDYKSANDAYYNVKEYVSSNYNGKSTARDNEARRLEVMAFSTNMDNELAAALDVYARNVEFDNLTDTEKEALTKYCTTLSKIVAENGNDRIYINYAFTGNMNTNYNFGGTLGEDDYNKLMGYISYRTWMCAETSIISVPINSTGEEAVNFGLVKRPQTKLSLEKHITALKITPASTGVQPIVDARADISQILNNGNISIKGTETKGLATDKSTRENRGWWKVETDIEELAQGATLEVEYTYVIKDESDEDYLSKTLIDSYENATAEKTYSDILKEIIPTVKTTMKKGTYSYSNSNVIGQYLGQYYYTGIINETTDEAVLSRVDIIEEALNNKLKLAENTANTDFVKTNDSNVQKTVYDVNGIKQTEEIETVIRNANETGLLKGGELDTSKKVLLTTVLTASSKEISYPSYIAEIVQYSNAAGKRDMEALPGNLSYVHSEDNTMTMENSNESDEFWGETIKVTKPTGENKQAPMQIAIVIITATAAIGVGIILIKKFALKK